MHWPLGLIASEWHNLEAVVDIVRNIGVSVPDGASLQEVEQAINQFNLGKAQQYLTQLEIPFPENPTAADIQRVYGEYNLNPAFSGEITSDTISAAKGKSKLYNPVTSRYLLPASLILLCLGIDFKGIINLGPKALIMFFAATFGIIIGGPIALFLINSFTSEAFIPAHPEDVWRGLSTVAGSWIGGGANQTAMKEIFEVSDNLFATMIIVDVVVANIWMAFLLFGANITERVDKWLKSDVSAIEDLKQKVANYRASIAKMPTTTSVFILMAVAFGGVALSHFAKDTITPRIKAYNDNTKAIYTATLIETDTSGAVTETAIAAVDFKKYRGHFAVQESRGYYQKTAESTTTIQQNVVKEGYKEGVLVDKGLSSLMSTFFWLVVFATTIGLLLSFTRARKLEGVGASRWGSVFIYVLVASIGMKMNLGEVYENLGLFAIGIVWMLVHVIILLVVAKLIKAPFFFVAVGSQANIGGAASAPIVASAFSPSLAPVGVLMAVLGYALGTYGAIICAYLMQGVS